MGNNYQLNKIVLWFLTAFFVGAWRLGFHSIHYWKQFRFCYHKLMSWNETLFAYAVSLEYTDLLLYLQLNAVYLPFNPLSQVIETMVANCNQPANYKHVMTKLIWVEKVRIIMLTFMIRGKSSIDLNEDNPHLSRHPALICRICLATSAHLVGLGLKKYVPLAGSMRLWEMKSPRLISF